MTFNSELKNKNLIITGPTATGKTHLAVQLARKFSGEIISVDSRQVYRGLDIGTGKDIEEYGINSEDNPNRVVPYHLIDVVDPNEDYNLLRFRKDVPGIMAEISGRGNLPIIAGGTPLYIDSLISDYEMQGGPPDAELRNSLNKLNNDELLGLLQKEFLEAYEDLKNGNNRKRMIRSLERVRSRYHAEVPELPENTEWLILGVYFHRQEVHRRIENRLDARLANGMVEEVERLHENGVSWGRLEFFGLEYKYIALHLQGKLTFQEMRDQLLIKIRQFAKRQDIWFRKMERAGKIIHWIRHGEFHSAAELVELFLADKKLPEPKIRISEIKYDSKVGK